MLLMYEWYEQQFAALLNHTSEIPESLGWPPDVVVQMAIQPALWMTLLIVVNRMSPNALPSCKRTHLLLPARKEMSPGTVEVLKEDWPY